MASRPVQASLSASLRPRLVCRTLTAHRQASTSSSPLRSTRTPSSSSSLDATHLTAPLTGSFREIKLALLDRALLVSQHAGLIDLSPEEISQVQTQEREALFGKPKDPSATREEESVIVAIPKRVKRPNLRYMTSQEIAEWDEGAKGTRKRKKEGRMAKKKEWENPGIKALSLKDEVRTVTLELLAKDSRALDRRQELKLFASGYLPALMWVNPSVTFKTTFGATKDALVVTSRTFDPEEFKLEDRSASAILHDLILTFGETPPPKTTLSTPPTVEASSESEINPIMLETPLGPGDDASRPSAA